MNIIHEWTDLYDTPHRLVTVGGGVEEQMQSEAGKWHVATKRHSDAVNELGKAIERIKELDDRTTWQPIATAPKNGELVLIWDNCRNSCVIAYHCDCGWLEGFHEYRIFHPTHWMPLPSTPKKEETE